LCVNRVRVGDGLPGMRGLRICAYTAAGCEENVPVKCECGIPEAEEEDWVM